MNPFAFRPAQVSFWTTVIYLALVIPLIVVNESVPPAPTDPTPLEGINITEAWLDLATLTNGYHPYNSHRNDEVRNWLLLRIQDILDENGVSWNTETTISKPPSNYSSKHLSLSGQNRRSTTALAEKGSNQAASASDVQPTSGYDVTVFNDLLSNVTCLFGGVIATGPGIATYFEGTNIIVYIRGTLDEDGDWWKSANTDRQKEIGKGGVLVNAHYDSVSTGYGATDDGVGVITVLQLIKYFTTPGHQPEHGIVALLNNAEEDYLYGARAFGKSPLMPFVHSFLNLEGAGAGGRAILFRTTDQDVTAAYAGVKDPFGTVIGSDAFGLGFIRSQTDYVVFNGNYGARGADIAFYRPRARYHTNQDDARHTSRASLWHMLSASITTVDSLSGDWGKKFLGERSDGDDTKVPNGKTSDGVWFDLFGKGFVLFNLRGMFAWSLTLLIATPLILALLTYVLHKYGKYYFFSSKVNTSETDELDSGDVEKVKIGGWKGFFRFPFALIVAGALNFGAALLLKKVNPFIVYSSEYAVWAMMTSLFYFVFWSIMKGADFARPSALHRGYVHIWLFILSWAILVAVTVFEDRFKIASGYPFVFFQSAVFLSTLIAFNELFALPNMRTYGVRAQEEDQVRDSLQAVPSADALIAPSPGEVDPATARDRDDDEEGEPATETTPLVGGRANGDNARTTFATTYRRSIQALTDVTRKDQHPDDGPQPYEDEQPWSGNLPTWTWLLQFLILGPFTIILVTQIGLVFLDAVAQTGPDGSSPLLPFLLTALCSILLLLPITPFIHRVTHHIPLFLLCVFVGTLIYNLVAFPFSADSRYKAYWQQLVNLDTGESTVKFVGIEDYLRPIIAELPSAAGKEVTCRDAKNRYNIRECVYDGVDVPPVLAGNVIPGVPPQKSFTDLVSVNITHGSAPGTASLAVNAKNTKACYLRFKKAINFTIKDGTGWDDRFGAVPESGIYEILLWRRDWNKTWFVDIEWNVDAKDVDPLTEVDDGQEHDGPDELKARAPGMEGEVSCLWSDINTPGTIPALDEALQFAPSWVAISKIAAGLVEGSKTFII